MDTLVPLDTPATLAVAAVRPMKEEVIAAIVAGFLEVGVNSLNCARAFDGCDGALRRAPDRTMHWRVWSGLDLPLPFFLVLGLRDSTHSTHSPVATGIF
eukprot:1153841-Prorocentrum_minimum.AAC.1